MTTVQISTCPTASTPEVLTLKAMRERYRTRLALAERLGLKEWFLKQFGSEKKWLQQFNKRHYDTGV